MPKRRNDRANLDPSLPQVELEPAPPSSSVQDNRVPEPINPRHSASVRRGLEQSRRREYATDAEVEAALAHFDR